MSVSRRLLKNLKETKPGWRDLDYGYEHDRSDGSSEPLFNKFVTEFDIIKTGRLMPLSGVKHVRHDTPFRTDHMVPYLSRSSIVYYAYHTYSKDERGRAKDLEWAAERGANIEFRPDDSWYYPGRTELVIFWWDP